MFEKLFENSFSLIINKPAGISVHNAEDENVLKTLASDGIHYYPVHRIDKETSGILILAKESSKVEELSKALKSAKKTYTAVCKGIIQPEQGQWDSPISDSAEGRKNPAGIKAKRKSALSKWKKIKSNKYFTMLEVTIETGRTHQIRKHSTLAKHPIVGDSRYSDKKYNERIKNIYSFNRMALHSGQLQITIGGELLTITCPTPDSFNTLFKD